MNKRHLILAASIGIVSMYQPVMAQQEAMFTHYMFNTISINPAYAGSRDALTITGLNRLQWVGFNGAPVTQTITAHTPIYRDNMGIGLSVINDKIGPVNLTSVYLDLAYRLELKEGSHLSFGLKSGINMMGVGLKDLAINDATDNAFLADVESKVLPNFGFGVYYNTDKFYVGLSSPRLLENDYSTNSSGSGLDLASEKKHYFLIAGYQYRLNDELEIRPTTFIKATNGAPIEMDVTARLIYDETIWLGLMGRTGDAAGLLLGTTVMGNLDIGYSFDWSFGLSTGKYNGGSHEIVLRYDFIYKDKEKIRSPRYF